MFDYDVVFSRCSDAYFLRYQHALLPLTMMSSPQTLNYFLFPKQTKSACLHL
jgi:hypothetical protein